MKHVFYDRTRTSPAAAVLQLSNKDNEDRSFDRASSGNGRLRTILYADMPTTGDYDHLHGVQHNIRHHRCNWGHSSCEHCDSRTDINDIEQL